MRKITGELVLLYQFPEEKARKLKTVLLCMGARAKVVTPEEFALSIGALAGVLPQGAEEETQQGEKDPGEMMVLHRFSSRRIDELLQRCRKAGVGAIPHKAVLTPSNAAWSGGRLYAELEQEHAAMQRGEMAHSEG